MFLMNYRLINDLYGEDSSSDNSVDIIDSESSEEIEEESAADLSDGTEEESASDSETSEEIEEEFAADYSDGTEDQSASDSETSEVTTQVITVSVDSLSYNGITPPMYYESFSILVFLLAAILGVALFNIFRSKL